MRFETNCQATERPHVRTSRTLRQVGLLTGAAALVGAPLSLSVFAGGNPAAAAVTLTVDSALEAPTDPTNCTTPVPGACTLRDALAAAAEGDTIDFASGLSGSIQLAGALNISVGVSIVGPGADVLTVHQTAFARIFDIGVAATDVVISGLTLDGGGSHEGGGAIQAFNSGLFTLNSVVVSGSQSNGSGGAIKIFNGGDITINESTIDGNSSPYGSGGGLAIRGDGRSISIIDSTLSNNTAGATYDGGGIAIFGSANEVTVANTTITGNSAGSGGGIAAYDDNTVTVVMSTISGNTSTSIATGMGYAGGIAFQQRTSGGGAALSATFVGDIVSANTSLSSPSAADIADERGEMEISVEDSLIGLASPFFDAGGTILSSSPGLGPLAANGGPTKTMAILSGSPAVAAGPVVIPLFAGNEWDQRGAPYRRLVGTRSDMGAYEQQTDPMPPDPSPSGDQVSPSFTG